MNPTTLDPTGTRTHGALSARLQSVALWVLAVLLMLAAASYQRRTGPSYPVRGTVELAGRSVDYQLIRSHLTTSDAIVSLAAPEGVSGHLFWRRYGMEEPFTAVPLRRGDGVLSAALPAQPPAGKLEYHLSLDTPLGTVRLPGAEQGTVVIRFRGDVPAAVLVPHILLMFLAMLFGMRAGLAALLAPARLRPLTAWSLGLMSIGGMILGPVVQKFAFGAFWTGFPFGGDLTDNKTLVMWLVWVAAYVLIAAFPRLDMRVRRAAVAGAAVVMFAVYVIPHSMKGSQLDYEQLERGVPAAEAITTG